VLVVIGVQALLGDPKFDQAVLPIITASATNPDLSKNGWKIFHRMLATDAKQGPDVANYIKDTLKAKTVFVIDDQSEYGKGLADQVRTTLGALAWVSDESIHSQATLRHGDAWRVFGGYTDRNIESPLPSSGRLRRSPRRRSIRHQQLVRMRRLPNTRAITDLGS